MNKVLVVDDEYIIRMGIKKMVEKFPKKQLDVHMASNGMEALSVLEKHRIKIVLTDIRMPKMDGLELVKQINLKRNDIKTVIVSGYDDFNYAKQAIKYGVREYLLKPLIPNDIYDVLDSFIDENKIKKQRISLSDYESWMDALDEAIWKLDLDHISVILERWEKLCEKSDRQSEELAELLKDSLIIIQKRMAKRSFSPQLSLTNELALLSPTDMFKNFSSQIMSIVDQLASMRNAKYKNPLEEAKAYIESHLAEEITLDETAQYVGISPTYFSQLFKKETNETFIQYRIRKRMNKAKDLMAVPHYRLIDICLDVGYNDYPHFTKTFKKYYGISPSQYRASIGIE